MHGYRGHSSANFSCTNYLCGTPISRGYFSTNGFFFQKWPFFRQKMAFFEYLAHNFSDIENTKFMQDYKMKLNLIALRNITQNWIICKTRRDMGPWKMAKIFLNDFYKAKNRLFESISKITRKLLVIENKYRTTSFRPIKDLMNAP